MRAVVRDRFGPPDVLRVEEVERPVPRDDEVLVKVHATTVNRSDCGLRAPHPWFARFLGTGLLWPRHRILGSELAGEVEAIGADVTGFQVGDRVFGINAWLLGAHAEYVCVRGAGALAPMPADATFEEAAAVCDGVILALMSMRHADLRPGRSILVYGASGSIGTAAVQLARYFGAHVTGVCGTKNLELVRSLGADEVIDYTKDDFTRNGRTYDVIMDAVGKHSFRRCRGSLRPGGSYLATDGLGNILRALLPARAGRARVVFPLPPRYTKADVLFLRALIENGSYRAVIDRCYPLDEVVEATRYVETEQKTGNVVLQVR